MKKLLLQIFFLCSLNTAVATECCNNQINDQIKRQKEVLLKLKRAQSEIIFADMLPIVGSMIGIVVSFYLAVKENDSFLPLAFALGFSGGMILQLKYRWRDLTWQRLEMVQQLQCELKRLNNEKRTK
jgi:hypothetical protein